MRDRACMVGDEKEEEELLDRERPDRGIEAGPNDKGPDTFEGVVL